MGVMVKISSFLVLPQTLPVIFLSFPDLRTQRTPNGEVFLRLRHFYFSRFSVNQDVGRGFQWAILLAPGAGRSMSIL